MTPNIETEVRLSLAPHGTGPVVVEGAGRHPTYSSAPQLLAPAALEPLGVLIVDDAASTRRFLRAVLEHGRDFDVVGEAGDGNAAVERARALQPDLVLLDMAMPFADGTSALNGVLQVAPHAKVVVVSGMNPTAGAPLLDAGASAFVLKGITPFELLERLGNILWDPGSIEAPA